MDVIEWILQGSTYEQSSWDKRNTYIYTKNTHTRWIHESQSSTSNDSLFVIEGVLKNQRSPTLMLHDIKEFSRFSVFASVFPLFRFASSPSSTLYIDLSCFQALWKLRFEYNGRMKYYSCHCQMILRGLNWEYAMYKMFLYRLPSLFDRITRPVASILLCCCHQQLTVGNCSSLQYHRVYFARHHGAHHSKLQSIVPWSRIILLIIRQLSSLRSAQEKLHQLEHALMDSKDDKAAQKQAAEQQREHNAEEKLQYLQCESG